MNGDLIAIAYRKMPNLSIYEEDEYGNDTGRYYTMNRYIDTPSAYKAAATLLSEQYNMSNPVAVAHQARNDERTVSLSPEFILKYDMLGTEDDKTKLTYEGQIIFSIYSLDDDVFYPGTLLSNNWKADSYNIASTRSYKSNSLSTRHSLTFQPYFKNEAHKMMLLLRMQYNRGNSSDQNYGIKWLPTTNDITSALAGGVPTSFSSGAGEWKSMFMLAQFHYAYKGKYIFDATIRRDGSVNFGPSRRWGNFPGISARWNISDEKFMEKVKWVDMLSIRPGWGIVGRAPGGQNYYSYYNTGNQYMSQGSVVPGNIRLSDLRWEEKETWNLGFDFGFFKGKLSGDISIYTQTTRDLLMTNRALPSSSGYGSLSWQNVGSMRNNGWEFNIFGRDIIKLGKFSMDFNVTFANNRNEILTMDETVLASMNADFNSSNGQYLSRVQLHNPLGSIYGFRYKGVYQYSEYTKGPNGEYTDIEIPGQSGPNSPYARDANGNIILDGNGNPKLMYFEANGVRRKFEGGDAIYEDINHDGSIDQLDIVYLGSSLPKLTGGFGFKLKYDKFSLNVQFNYRYGNKVVNAARMGLENMATSDNQSRSVNWRWRNQGDNFPNMLPRAVTSKVGQSHYNYLGSDRFVEDASFLRLNYLQLSYALDSKVLKQWGLSQLSFYLTMNNLFVLTKYSGADPEIVQAGFAPATDHSRTPRAKSFTVGATVAF